MAWTGQRQGVIRPITEAPTVISQAAEPSFDGEEWRAVVGYDRYQVSNFGRIRRHDGRLIAINRSKRYLRVSLYSTQHKRGLRFDLHRLVATAFLGPIPRGMHVDHINHDKHDCRVENLRIATHDQNMANMPRRESQSFKGVHVYGSKFKAVVNGTCLGVFSDAADAAIAYDAKARELFGSFAVLNFPEVSQ